MWLKIFLVLFMEFCDYYFWSMEVNPGCFTGIFNLFRHELLWKKYQLRTKDDQNDPRIDRKLFLQWKIYNLFWVTVFWVNFTSVLDTR